MKCIFFKYNIFLFILFVIGCETTQSSRYNPHDGGTGWKVNVSKVEFLGDEFICTINDSTITRANSSIGYSFETTGQYRGKKVSMKGETKSKSSWGYDEDGVWKSISTDFYHIRVFINDVEVDYFDFED